MANGDLLYHIPIYRTALKEDGTYDFHENFEYVKPWLKQADLVLGDFEGTVNKDHYLAG
ncbi:metallophosphatase, partial [Streptococcus pneumoniae]|nr:metallophosphatase [Streptococcus pneumoniae]